MYDGYNFNFILNRYNIKKYKIKNNTRFLLYYYVLLFTTHYILYIIIYRSIVEVLLLNL